MTPLLAQSRRGERAFERLYRRHVGDVYRYVLVVLRNPEDAEDVTQTTFLNAYRAYGQGERPRNARAWLIAIAHNVCRQRFRTASRRPLEVDLEDDYAAQAVPDETAPTAGEIRRAIDQLAFNQRAALVMRELEGRSYAEIAEVLSLSVGAVETLVFRARRALREQLEGNLSCHEAERAISRQIDGVLPRPERGALRAHLRECEECARFARSQRAQRPAWKALGMVPLPASLESFFGPAGAVSGAGAGVGGVAMGVAAKTLAVAAIGASAVGVGYEGVKHQPWGPPAAKVEQHVAPAAAPLIPVQRASVAVTRPARRGQSAKAPRAGKKAEVRVARPVKAIKVTSPGQAKRRAAKPAKPARATKSAKLKKEKSVPVSPSHATPVRARGNPSPPGQAKREGAKAKEPVGRKLPTPPAPQPELDPQFPPLPLPELPVDMKLKKAK